MPYSDVIRKEFYQKLGKLFYAMAMADKTVRPGEVQQLRNDIRKYWLDLDDAKDEFGTDVAYQIEIVFDWLQEEEGESETYFREFSGFYKEHGAMFSEKLKSLILKTSSHIASSFAGRNKSELILLARLQNLFEGR